MFPTNRARRWHKSIPARPRTYFRLGALSRARERRFVRALWPKIAVCWDELSMMTPSEAKKTVRFLGVLSLQEALYHHTKVLKMDGAPTKNALRQADYLLHMPRIQARLEMVMRDGGLSDERCAQVMAEIVDAVPALVKEIIKPDGTIEREYGAPTAGDRLRAIDMRFRLTTGYAPTKALTMKTKPGDRGSDQMFDESEFQSAPPIATSMPSRGEPVNVTPKKRRR